MPGKIYIEQINLNGRILFTVTSNPNGVLSGNAGDLAIRSDAPNGTVYVNVDGALLWVDLAAVAVTSPWTRVGTDVQLVVNTDFVGIGIPTPSTKLHVDSLAASTVPVLTLENLVADWQAFTGSGSPEGIVTASRGDLFFDDSGSLWLKVLGDATNTGWRQILHSGNGPFWQQGGNSYGALGVFGTNDAFAVAFRTSGIEHMRLLTTGELVLGNTVPVGSELLRVDGGARFDGDVVIGGDLVVNGTTFSVDSETVLVADNHLYLNNGYTVPAPTTGGLVVNFLPIAVADTVGVGGFVAGVAGVSNPTVQTVGVGTFAVGQFVQVSGTGPDPSFPINDGLFEVLSHVGTTLTIRGVGLVGTVEDFTQNQFTTDATVAGAITRVTVSVSRAGVDGLWETGQGSVTPIVFSDFVTTALGGAARWGNVVFVDKVFGNNATGARNGPPFLTITAALAAALAGDVVYVLPGVYDEAISIPASVSVVGIGGIGRVTIQRLAVVAATTLVTLNVNSSIENCSLNLTQTALPLAQLRAVEFLTLAAVSAKIVRCRITVNSSGVNGAVDNTGIYVSGGGGSNSVFACVVECEIVVNGQGAGTCRGILNDIGNQNVIIENTLVLVTRAGAVVGTYYAAEVDQPGANLILEGGSYQGPTGTGGADVSQTGGTLTCDGAILVTSNANGLGFTARSGTYTEWFGQTGALPAGLTRYFRHGTQTVQATELQFGIRAQRVARAIVVGSVVGAGGGQTAVFTLRKNGATPATPVTATLAGGGPGGTTAFQDTVSTVYAVGDTFSLQVVTSAGSGVSDVQVGIEWYTG